MDWGEGGGGGGGAQRKGGGVDRESGEPLVQAVMPFRTQLEWNQLAAKPAAVADTLPMCLLATDREVGDQPCEGVSQWQGLLRHLVGPGSKLPSFSGTGLCSLKALHHHK